MNWFWRMAQPVMACLMPPIRIEAVLGDGGASPLPARWKWLRAQVLAATRVPQVGATTSSNTSLPSVALSSASTISSSPGEVLAALRRAVDAGYVHSIAEDPVFDSLHEDMLRFSTAALRASQVHPHTSGDDEADDKAGGSLAINRTNSIGEAAIQGGNDLGTIDRIARRNARLAPYKQVAWVVVGGALVFSMLLYVVLLIDGSIPWPHWVCIHGRSGCHRNHTQGVHW